jgi:hypothetical protein
VFVLYLQAVAELTNCRLPAYLTTSIDSYVSLVILLIVFIHQQTQKRQT